MLTKDTIEEIDALVDLFQKRTDFIQKLGDMPNDYEKVLTSFSNLDQKSKSSNVKTYFYNEFIENIKINCNLLYIEDDALVKKLIQKAITSSRARDAGSGYKLQLATITKDGYKEI